MIINTSKIISNSKYYLVVLILYFTSTIGTLYMLFPYLPLMFLNRKLFHSLSDFSLRLWFGLSVFLLEKVCGIKICLHNSKTNICDIESDKSSIVLMNHRTRLDWLFYFCILYRLNALSKIKIILKDGLKKIPGPSWAMQTSLFIFIKRRWNLDQEIFNKFLDYYKLIEKKFMILIFPEGTNLTQDTILKSNKFAEEKNLSKYEYVLHPRITGFIHIFNEMKKNQQIGSIHDITIAYRGGKIPETELDFLNGNLPEEIHFFIDKFECEKILKIKDENQNENKDINKLLEDWLSERWKQKEAFLKNEANKNELNNTIENNYDTKNQTKFESAYLFIYPVYWLLSFILVLFLWYNYFMVKIYFLISVLFYIYQDYFRTGLDNFIISTSLKKSI